MFGCRVWAIAYSGALSLSAVACGSGAELDRFRDERDTPEPEDSGPGEAVALTEIPSTIAEVECGALFECCSPEELKPEDATVIDLSTEKNCVTAYEELLDTAIPAIKEAVSDGRLEYDAQSFAECVEVRRAASCEQLRGSTVSECPDFLIPLVSEGQPCDADRECKSANCESGTCVALPKRGDPCDYACEVGSFCNDRGVCGAPLPDGSPCFDDGECESDHCTTDGVCGLPLFCSP